MEGVMLRNKPARDSQLAIEIPVAEKDKPAWVKVGVIAAVGFIVGIAWPRLVGVRIGPSAPNESAASASAAHGGRAPDAPPASVTKTVGMPTVVSSAAGPGRFLLRRRRGFRGRDQQHSAHHHRRSGARH